MCRTLLFLAAISDLLHLNVPVLMFQLQIVKKRVETSSLIQFSVQQDVSLVKSDLLCLAVYNLFR